MTLLALISLSPWFDVSGGFAFRDSAQGMVYGLNMGLEASFSRLVLGAQIGYHRFSLDYQEDTLINTTGSGFQPGLATLQQSCDAMQLCLRPGWLTGNFRGELMAGLSLHTSNRAYDETGRTIHKYPDVLVPLAGMGLAWRGSNMALGILGQTHFGSDQDRFNSVKAFVRFYLGQGPGQNRQEKIFQ